MDLSLIELTIREAQAADLPFIQSLSPSLAQVAKLGWHTDETVQTFQDDYITEMMAETPVPNVTLIAETGGTPAGFIHVREHTDEISGESCATVPLLAVSDTEQGAGIGTRLMEAAEQWAKARGFRLLHLEVFAANNPARGFYGKLGFEEETVIMVKPLD